MGEEAFGDSGDAGSEVSVLDAYGGGECAGFGSQWVGLRGHQVRGGSRQFIAGLRFGRLTARQHALRLAQALLSLVLTCSQVPLWPTNE
ncbi:hypothetical protein GCM10010324_49990 [Streptomyces hiroshimensis]|uniref:Uncharacterized protein n=1 Tax=Streptomyces hiroshimensis TaxID=66424 RepID=A0ABQ2YYL9_9ACTN|nr:hypothetical protein GCM10010324_49990 [Streptomyces hiroshimensis]